MRMTGTKIDPKRSLADIVSPTYLYSVSGSRQLEEDFVISVKHSGLSHLNVPNIGS